MKVNIYIYIKPIFINEYIYQGKDWITNVRKCQIMNLFNFYQSNGGNTNCPAIKVSLFALRYPYHLVNNTDARTHARAHTHPLTHTHTHALTHTHMRACDALQHARLHRHNVFTLILAIMSSEIST